MSITLAGGATVYPFGLLRPNSSQTLVTVAFNNVAADTSIYTVPAGKTLYIVGVVAGGAAGNTGIKNKTGSGYSVGGICTATSSFSVACPVPCLSALAGEQIYTMPYVAATGCFWGWLE